MAFVPSGLKSLREESAAETRFEGSLVLLRSDAGAEEVSCPGPGSSSYEGGCMTGQEMLLVSFTCRKIAFIFPQL